MIKTRTAGKISAAVTVLAATTAFVAPASAASNDWHRVSTGTFNRFCSSHHSRWGVSLVINNHTSRDVGGASAHVCWGGGHVGVQANSADYAADGRGVRAQIRYRVAVGGHWSGYHYRVLAVDRHGSGRDVGSHTYSANHGTKGVAVRVQLFDKHGHVTAYGAWR